mgnify:CR=1 FL=1
MKKQHGVVEGGKTKLPKEIRQKINVAFNIINKKSENEFVASSMKSKL